MFDIPITKSAHCCADKVRRAQLFRGRLVPRA